MNGKPWTDRDTDTLKTWAGREPDATIGRRTGHSERTIQTRRALMGLPAYVGRPIWTRRDWLLNSAAGLDFQM